MKKEELIEGQKFARKCDATGEGMNEGFCFGDGTHYYKYEKDALAHAKRQGYKTLAEAYKEEEYYHTAWEDESDFQYIVQDGDLVDIDDLDDRQIIELEEKFNEQKEVNAWDFVVKHYPDYDHADEIAWEGDLHKLLNEEDEEGDAARKLLEDEYEGDLKKNYHRIEADHATALLKIYEESIKNYLSKGGK